MINPIYEKILNVICKSSCGTTCDKCYQCANSCAKYAEYSKLSISLGKSGLFSIEKTNIPNAQDILNTVNFEKKVYEHALRVCVGQLVDLRRSMGFNQETVDNVVLRYCLISKEVIRGREQKNAEDKRRQYHPSQRR